MMENDFGHNVRNENDFDHINHDLPVYKITSYDNQHFMFGKFNPQKNYIYGIFVGY